MIVSWLLGGRHAWLLVLVPVLPVLARRFSFTPMVRVGCLLVLCVHKVFLGGWVDLHMSDDHDDVVYLMFTNIYTLCIEFISRLLLVVA